MGSIHRTRKSTLLLSLARQSKNDYDDSEETQKMTKNTVTDNLEPSRATPKMETWLLNQLENVIAITIHHYNIMNNIVARTWTDGPCSLLILPGLAVITSMFLNLGQYNHFEHPLATRAIK